MSQLINDTIEAYNLYLEGELSLDELEYGIEAGLISESLLLELDATMLSEASSEPSAFDHYKSTQFDKGKILKINNNDNSVEETGIIDHVKDHATEYGAAAAGLAAAGAGAYALHKYLKNRKAKKNAEALKQAVNNIKK